MGIDQVIIYGSSYGSYLAGVFGARYPDRVAGMVLDSAMLDASGQHVSAQALNELYWRGTATTRDHAARVRSLAEQGFLNPSEAGSALQILHESGGPDSVAKMLTLLEAGRGTRVLTWIQQLGKTDIMRTRPFLMEFDLVAHYAITELGYGSAHDAADGPLTTADALSNAARGYSPFTGAPDSFRPPAFQIHLAHRCDLG